MPFQFFSVILGQPNYCESAAGSIEVAKVRKVHVHPTYRAKKGKGKKNMPIFDFALIEVTKDMRTGTRKKFEKKVT